MKITTALCSIAVAGFLAGCASESQSQLLAQAKISRADAQATAAAKVSYGTVKEAELERENGKLMGSFDFATPDSKDITEVNVDAVSCALVNIEHEKGEAAK